MSDVLTFSRVSKGFRLPSGKTFFALQDTSFSVQEGTVVSIMGASGSGKTTCLTLAGGLDTPSGGQISLFGKQQSPQSFEQLRRKELSFVLQRPFLIQELSVLENVAIGGLGKDVWGRSRDTLSFVEIPAELWASKPSVLSCGQAQRVALARALVTKPSLLICDEPTAGLDSGLAHRVFDLLYNVAVHAGMTVIIATHDESLAQKSHKVFSLINGKVLPRVMAE